MPKTTTTAARCTPKSSKPCEPAPPDLLMEAGHALVRLGLSRIAVPERCRWLRRRPACRTRAAGLPAPRRGHRAGLGRGAVFPRRRRGHRPWPGIAVRDRGARAPVLRPDRKSVVLGKSVEVRVDLGGRRII